MNAELVPSCFRALGTGCRVLCTDPDGSDAALSAVRDELALIDEACSRFRDDSELSAIGRAGGTHSLSPVLFDALSSALRAAVLTEGAIDPTVGKSIRLLGYNSDFAKVEASGPPVTRFEVAAGWRAIRLDAATRSVSIPHGVLLDLGATAKALAADRAAARASEITHAGVLVSLGGDIAVAGSAPEGGWRVRVSENHADPDDDDGPMITVESGGVATSSTTVRTWKRGGVSLHHIIDPSTGRPAEVVWRTVSVVAASCVDANIASTASIIFGEKAPKWLESVNLDSRLVRADGRVTYVGRWPAAGQA